MPASKVLTVAWREFKQTVLRKVFLLAVIGLPVLGVGAIALAAVVMNQHQEPPLIGTIAIVADSGEVAEAARIEFEPDRIADQQRRQEEAAKADTEDFLAGAAGKPDLGSPSTSTFRMGVGRGGEVSILIEPHTNAGEAEVERLKQRVRGGELLAAAVVPEAVLEAPDPKVGTKERPRFDLVLAGGVDADHADFIERRLGSAIVRVRADRAGLDPDATMAMLDRPDASTRRILASGEETSENRGTRALRSYLIPMAFMMLLWIAVISSAQHLMMSTIEEKSNRVMEVLLSAVSPLQLVTGKILGHGAVGLLIMLLYSSLGLAGLVAAAQMHVIEPMDLVYLFVYFFMAYFMVASIMAAVGSAVSDIREANTLVTPVMMIMVIPLMLWMPISQAPNGPIATAFSFIPPASPFVMILRIGADEPVPLWQIPATIVWGYACVGGLVWMAAKIFRVGVLMYGKPPTPLQLLKWVRYA